MSIEKTLSDKASISKPWLKFYDGIEIPEIPKQTIYDTIVECCDKYSDRIAIEYFNTRLTYKELLNNIDRTADAYIAAGIRPGDYVSLCVLATPESVYSLFALAKIGAISNFFEPRCNPKRILRHTNDTGSRILVVLDVFIDKLEQIKDDLNVDRIIIVSLSESMSGLSRMSFRMSVKGREIVRKSRAFNGTMWDDFIAEGVTSESFTVPYAPDTVASIVYTGGTTGLPKGAMITHDTFNTLWIDTIICYPQMFDAGTFLNIMPPFASYGLLFGLFIPYAMGLCCQIIPIFTPANFDKLLLKHKPGCVFGVPYFFESLTTSPLFAHRSLDFLKIIVTGGDRFDPTTETMVNAFLKSHGCRTTISKGYGMTEMGSAATFSLMSHPEAAVPGSAGIPLYFNNVMIIDEETGEELDYNHIGEICLTGPTMTKGYINNEDETRNLLHVHSDGTTWVHSGDIGYMTEDGLLYVVDRKKRMIIRPDCHKVFPSLIEQTLLEHPAVAQCCAVGLPAPDSDIGHLPTAFVVLNDGYEASEELIEELDEFSSQHLPERDVASNYKFLDSLPVTGIGKIDYRALEKKYSA